MRTREPLWPPATPGYKYYSITTVENQMPLFQSRLAAPTEPAAAEAALKKPGLFHSRREPSPARTTSTATSSSGDVRSKRGSFLRRSHDDGAVAVAEQQDAPQRSSSLLHKGLYKMSMGGNDRDLDPSILRAREHVMGAEAAEEEADRALDAARRRVREAREHVRRLEEEAEADARRARIKQHHAAEVSKRGKVLGREYYKKDSVEAMYAG